MSPSSSYGLRSPREKSTARDLPARIRVVDAPFPIAISAPSLELGNPHGSRRGHALANARQDNQGAAGLARAQKHSAHGALHRACAGSI